MAAIAGVDAHEEDEVGVFGGFGSVGEGSGGVEHDTGATSALADGLERAVEVRAYFGVNGNPVGSGVGKLRDVVVGVGDHEVYVKGQCGCGANCRHEADAERDGRDKVSVHDVDMQNVCSGCFALGDLTG